MKIVIPFILLIIISQSTLFGKTVNAYRLSSIFYDEDIKFSQLFKYYFYGHVCDVEIQKNALGEISSADFDICDVEIPNNKATRERYYDAGEDYNIMARLKNIHGKKLCFKIKDIEHMSMFKTRNTVHFRSIDFKENCKFINKINYSKSLEELNGELPNHSYAGKNVDLVGSIDDLKIYSDSFLFELKNKSSEYNCLIDMYGLSDELKDKLIQKVKIIRNKKNSVIRCYGPVSHHWYYWKNHKIEKIKAYDFDIIRIEVKRETLYRDTPYSKFVVGGKKWFKTGDEITHVKYEGEIENGVPNGQGTSTFFKGMKYVGEFKDGEKNGQGTLTTTKGSKWVGEFKNGRPNGQGTTTFFDGVKYVGNWKDGKFHGQGTQTWPNGMKYVGNYKDHKAQGQGTLTLSSGRKYVGKWKNGEKCGGTEYDKDGNIILEVACSN